MAARRRAAAAAPMSPLFALWLLATAIASRRVAGDDDVHILYLTDCRMYSDWQSVGMAFAFRNSGQRGHMTRVMCCTDTEKAGYNHDMLDIMESHVAPSFAVNPRTGDNYAAFNKPGAVLDFMTKGSPAADYMLVIDSDMLLRHPFRPQKYEMVRGKAVSADYTYMVGCTNDLAVRHIPEIPIRNDTRAGPFQRYCDMVGGYTFMHRDDLSTVAPLWLSITEDVREDPESWRLSGDQYVQQGGKPWISEMYGYSFACAKSGVWHTWDTHVMHYPGSPARGVPNILHYGLYFEFGGYKFDKHWHYDFDVAQCAPWDLSDPNKRTGGVFEHPPHISALGDKSDLPRYFGDLLSMETIVTINAGLCHYHLRHCPPGQQMLDECAHALSAYDEVRSEVHRVEKLMLECKDVMVKCPEWAAAKQCETNPAFMEDQCRLSCNLCQEDSAMLARHPEPARDELEDMLLGLRKTLAQVDDESGGNGASIGTSTGSSGRRGEMDVGSGSDGSGGGGGGSEHVVRDPDGAAVVRSPDDGGRADGLLQSGSGGTRLDPAARDAARRLGAADGDVAAPDVHGGARHLRPAGGGDGRDGDDGRGGDDVTASLREDDDLLPRVRGTRRSGKRGGGGGSSGVPMSAVLVLWVVLLGFFLVAAPSCLLRMRRRNKATRYAD